MNIKKRGGQENVYCAQKHMHSLTGSHKCCLWRLASTNLPSVTRLCLGSEASVLAMTEEEQKKCGIKRRNAISFCDIKLWRQRASGGWRSYKVLFSCWGLLISCLLQLLNCKAFKRWLQERLVFAPPELTFFTALHVCRQTAQKLLLLCYLCLCWKTRGWMSLML